MKRSLQLLAILSIAIASLVWAQTPSQATLRLPGGDHLISTFKLGEQTLFSLDDVVAALGGSVIREQKGFRIKVGNVEAALAADTRFAVVRDDLIEMPNLPTLVDNKLYVNWQLFDGLLRKANGQEMSWDATSHVLNVRAMEVQAVNVTVSAVDLGDLSKVVFQFSGPADYSINREPTRYLIQFSTPIKAPFAEQSFDSALVSKVVFNGNAAEIDLTTDSVVGDPYRLEGPVRLVLDLKKGVAPIPANTLPAVTLHGSDRPGIRTIVLDAGHGGKDVGATGPSGLLEKDTTLAICRKLAPMLEKSLGARVILTRSDDTLIPLDQRTAIANQYKADLFLSVHLNAAVVKNAHGSETYFLSLEASDELARHAAESENFGAGAIQPPPPSSSPDISLILWDLAQQDYIKESSRFAEVVQDEMNHLNNVQNRGVKQAPFRVLVGATMPAALVEVGFISNPDEETKLRDEKYQSTLASTLAQAVMKYKNEYEVRIGVTAPPAPPAPLAPATTTATTTATSSKPAVPAQTETAAAKRNPGR